MQNLGQLLTDTRLKKKISYKKISTDLLIKKERIISIEKGEWDKLPEPAFVKSFLISYSKYLGLDPDFVLALYRREYDENKYPHKESPLKHEKRFMLTPNKVAASGFILTVVALVIYFFIQYLSVLRAPTLEVFTPQNDTTTNVPIINLSGKTETQTDVTVNGVFIAVDEEGNFSHQIELEEGRNVIEIIASKRLSPKSKQTRIIRLSR